MADLKIHSIEELIRAWRSSLGRVPETKGLTDIGGYVVSVGIIAEKHLPDWREADPDLGDFYDKGSSLEWGNVGVDKNHPQYEWYLRQDIRSMDKALQRLEEKYNITYGA